MPNSILSKMILLSVLSILWVIGSVHSLLAQKKTLNLGELTMTLSESPSTLEESPIGNQAVIFITIGPDLNQRILEQPIKYASPARIWLEASDFDEEQTYFYVNGAMSRFDFRPKTSQSQRLIISGLADFSSVMGQFSLKSGSVYKLEIDIYRLPADIPSMEQAMDPSSSFLFEDMASSEETDMQMTKAKGKNGFFRFGWMKSVVTNKYVQIGAAAILVSAGGYFGYQLLGNEKSGPNLPLPPAPPQ